MGQIDAADRYRVMWPQGRAPQDNPVHVRNEIHIPAAPEIVWAWLLRAPLWPQWYANSHEVEILGGRPRSDLAAGTRFRWRTFGVGITSEVIEFVPNERIAWSADGFGVDAYHAWVLLPVDDGCRVLTEETQHGFGARLMDIFMPKRMWEGHELWLNSLRLQSLQGMPPGG